MELVVEDAKTLLPSSFPSLKSHPWLFLFKDARVIFYNILECRRYDTHLSFLKDKEHINGTSKDGWMVLQDRKNHHIFLFNAYSFRIVQLPELKIPHNHNNYAFLSSTPDDPDCYVVLSKEIEESYILSFCKIGDKTFVTQILNLFEERIKSLISFGGYMYGLIKYDKYDLVRIEFKGKNIQFQELLVRAEKNKPLLRRQCFYETTQNYIAESCGNIILVVKSYLGHSRQITHLKDIKIFRADLRTKEWIEMETIGEHTIFLEHFGGMICIHSDNANVKKNCVYFVGDKEGNAYVFDIGDKSITSLPCCHDNDKLYSYPRWIC